MSVEDRLVETFKALDPDVRPDAPAWSAVEARLRRRPWWRRMWVLVVAIGATAGGGVGAAQLLAPASRSSVDVVTEKPSPQDVRDEELRRELEEQREADAELTTIDLRAVDWASTVVGPLGCNAVSGALRAFDATVEEVAYPGESGGPAVAVVAARCDANGSPPFGLFVFGPNTGADGASLVQTIVAPTDDLHPFVIDGTKFLMVAGAGISVDLAGYSSPSLCRACADQVVTRTWRWSDGQVSTTPPRPIANRVSRSSRLSFEGFGPILLGMTRAEASAASGLQVVMSEGCQPESWAYFAGDPFGDLSNGFVAFGVVNDRIVKVWVSVSGMATDKGVRIGSTREEALAAYPDAKADENIYGTPTLTVTDSRGHVIELLLDDNGVVWVMRLATSVENLPVGDC